MKAQMLRIIADAHFALASDGTGNGREALRAAKEAVSIYQELRDKAMEAITLHIRANAELMTKNFLDAQQTAKSAEGLFQEVGDAHGEASSMLLVGGAHLGQGSFDQARTAGHEARDLFRQAEDEGGEDAVEAFLDTLKKYE